MSLTTTNYVLGATPTRIDFGNAQAILVENLGVDSVWYGGSGFPGVSGAQNQGSLNLGDVKQYFTTPMYFAASRSSATIQVTFIPADAAIDPTSVVSDSSADTTSPVAAASSPRNRALRDFVSVLDYGVYTTGDMTSTLQAAVTDAITRGKKLYIPGNTYTHSARLIGNANGLVIEGNGPGSSILKLAAGSNSNSLRFNNTADGTGATRLSKFVMRGVTLNHQGSSQTDQGGIEGCLVVFATDDVWIEDCEFLNVRNGGLQVYASSNAHIRDNVVDTVIYSQAGNAIDVSGTSNALAVGTDCTVVGNTVRNGSTNAQAIDIYVAANASRITVVGNRTFGASKTGLILEIGAGVDSTMDVSVVGNQVQGKSGTGLGVLDTSGTNTGPKSRNVTIQGNTVNGCSPGLSLTGHGLTAVGNTIDQYGTDGIVVGSGSLDYEESDITITGNTVRASSSATGHSIHLSKSGTLTNFIHDVSIVGNTLVGALAASGSHGIALQGKIKNVEIVGNTIRGHGADGIQGAASGGASPSGVDIASNQILNNNQSQSATATLQVGISIESGCDKWTVEHNRIADDQGTQTQVFGIHALSATRVTIKDNDLSGNLTGPINWAPDSLSVFEGNKLFDAQYEGLATLVAGTVTVSTGAVTNSSNVESVIELSVKTPGGTQGGLFVSAISNKTSFTIKSTSSTDTSVVKWRIR